jgi:hypothetical protein
MIARLSALLLASPEDFREQATNDRARAKLSNAGMIRSG